MSDGVDARIGAKVAGRFLVEERIGAGASGVVYRAVQEPLGRRVALKMLASTDAGDARRLAREAQAIARLRHENVVVVHDVGEDAGVPFIAMEYVEGTTLRAVLDEGPLPVDVAVDVARGVARALAHAHESGVVHRDLKPQNVMLAGGKCEGTAVRVVDFGLARLTLTTGDTESVSASITGTPAYMAPEQIEPKPDAAPGPASDVYALGVVLYEALTGTNPFRAETPFKTLMRHVEGPVPNPPSTWTAGVPPRIDALVTRMLQKSAAARPSASEVASALDPVMAVAPSTPAPSAPQPRPSLVPRVAAVLALVAAGALGVRALVGAGDDVRDAGVSLIDTVPLDAGAPPLAPIAASRPDAGALPVAPVAASPPDGGALPVAPVDAGTAPSRAVVDAGVRRLRPVDAGTRPAPDAPVVDVLPPHAGARPASALERKVRALSSCAEPCAADVIARLEAALAGDLGALKAYRADVDACRARCGP